MRSVSSFNNYEGTKNEVLCGGNRLNFTCYSVCLT
jgi:hypothetical protein